MAPVAINAPRAGAAERALAVRARDLQDAVEQALAAGTGFKEAVKPSRFNVQTTPEFDLSTELNDPYAETLVGLCLNVEQGGLCGPAPVEDGVILAYVSSRTATDIVTGLPALRAELVEGLSHNRAQRLASAWQESLLEQGKFKDLQ